VADATTLAMYVTDISSATLGAVQSSGRYHPMTHIVAISL
jgi:hypothetical protein